MQVNCDLGEGLDAIDAALMPYIDMASIACGGHTGDRDSMTRALTLAHQHGLMIGAHPSYPDRLHFGRFSQPQLSSEELFDSLCRQVNQLKTLSEDLNTKLHYIKAHGALYNDSVHNQERFGVLIRVAQLFSLPLVIQAHPLNNAHEKLSAGVELIREAFADRAYMDNGNLVARNYPHAVLSDVDQAIEQVSDIQNQGRLRTENGNWLAIKADTICLHSDSPNAVALARALRQLRR